MFVYPYKKGSKSANALGKALGIKVMTRPKRSRSELIVNWGTSSWNRLPFFGRILNSTESILKASNKLSSFEVFKENNIPSPDFTTDINVAKEWIEDGHIVVCRKLLRSHSGKGIVIAETIDQLVDAPLYVKYFPKSYEFRIHVFNGKVIDAVKKRKRNGVVTNYNKYVRCHNNGWVFCRKDLVVNDKMKELAINAVKCLGLDFGAVDICQKSNGKMVCLEVNTAPSLSGPTTLKSYTNAIKEYVNG